MGNPDMATPKHISDKLKEIIFQKQVLEKAMYMMFWFKYKLTPYN